MNDPNFLDWVNTLSAAAGTLAVIIGLFGANSTIKANRRSAQQLRRSEVAENLIAISLSIEDAFRHIRNPFDRIPAENAGDKKFTFQRRYERIIEYNPLFKELRDAQIRARAVLGEKDVDQAVESLFRSRNNIIFAIESLSEEYFDDNAGDLTDEEKKMKTKWRKDMYGSFSENDELGTSILSAIKKIEKLLSPIARLEA